MTDTRYKPTSSLRFYPGASLSADRKAALDNFDVEIDDVTYDDILYSTSLAFTRTVYTLLSIVEDRWGKEASHEVAHELAYRSGKSNMKKWLRRNNATEGTPELMAKLQDLLHGLRGPAHAKALTEYDHEKCVERKTGCIWHSGRPEGMESYCKYMLAGFFKAYMEVDPALECESHTCMFKGDDQCEYFFWYRKKQQE